MSRGITRNLKPWFSIVVPVLNEQENIPALLQSIFKQTYRPIEVIVVDDGSTDRTTELVEQFSDDMNDEYFRISIISVKEFRPNSRGPAFARNLGIDRALGQYILMVDGDFVLSDTRIVDKLFSALQSNHTARFRTNVQTDSWLEYNLMLDRKSPLFRYTIGPRGSISGLAFRKRVLEGFHFDESLGTGEDKDLLDGIARAGLLNPTMISETGVKHLPHTFMELKDQKQWYGRTALLWLRKHHSLKDLLVLSPALPSVLLIGQLICFLLNTTFQFAFVAAFLIILLFSLLKSPVKGVSRMVYLIFVRFIYGSFCFSLGIIQALAQVMLQGRIDTSRK